MDVVRFGAAIMVVVDLLTLPLFNLGFSNLESLGYIAVPVFFVLSGFVIRYVTRTRESTLREYFIDRVSRIYSVVLPAIVLTAALWLFFPSVGSSRIAGGNPSSSIHSVLALISNMVFLSQAWGHSTVLYWNVPFWSLGYECVYYAFYGFLFFLRGWKRTLMCAALAALIGPQVLFLFPVWWLGCWLYDLYQRYRKTWVSLASLLVAAAWLGVGGALCLIGHSAVLQAPATVFRSIIALPNPLVKLHMPEVRATLFAIATGIFSFVALIPLLFLMDFFDVSRSSLWARSVRQVANGTFTVYLMHYPLLVLLSYTGLLRRGHRLSDALIVSAMCLILVAVAVPVDWLKLTIRRWLKSLFRPVG